MGHGALGMGHWGSGIQMKNYGICSNPKHICECFPNPQRCTEFRLRSTTASRWRSLS
ncbi:hypothetical protein IQ246_29075 [aff. Roholtiella sp. LEGE 12411]|uniref:hypothetical protein n=1 Tax=aff. Roholtiella sp. LEGE 12411 TaxID=1828822 RepID=UPI00187FC34B|nr:hypothetical protein [aff. Roholtiella sp. LEGE 12411]MBE9039062.1 hypothetical protein [aff. Roholtiella sp. LEGE 12411]